VHHKTAAHYNFHFPGLHKLLLNYAAVRKVMASSENFLSRIKDIVSSLDVGVSSLPGGVQLRLSMCIKGKRGDVQV